MKRRMVLTAMVLFLFSGLAMAKEFEVAKKAGDYNVVVTIDKNPPTTGDNTMTVAVKDGSGATVTNAKVSVEYSMPAMPGMPPMKYNAEALLAGAIYKTKMNFSMAGPWNVVGKIVHGGKTAQVKFTVDVR